MSLIQKLYVKHNFALGGQRDVSSLVQYTTAAALKFQKSAAMLMENKSEVVPPQGRRPSLSTARMKESDLTTCRSAERR